MLANYITIAFRHLLKNSVYSFINIAGLSVGLACSILILLWVSDEMSYDTFHENADRIHQVWINAEYDGTINSYRTVPFQTKDALKGEDSRIKNTALSGHETIHLLTANEKQLNRAGQIVSEEFLDIFRFDLAKGSHDAVLDDPASIVITESLAKSLFGDSEPIDKLITIDNKFEVKVTGVLKDLPANSSFQFNFLIPIKLFENEGWVQEGIDDWGDYNWFVYVELQEDVRKEEVEPSIRNFLAKVGQTDMRREFFLHPLLRWRLHTTFENGNKSGGFIEYVRGFTIIAVFILVIACINFMNLSTARSERRAREVGIRKTVGSRRSQLIRQFLGESTFIAGISFLFAIVLVEVALPFYNELVDKNLFIQYTSLRFWLSGVGIVVITGLFAGSYPAFYLSSFAPLKVLKGKIQSGRNAATPRQALVVLQFVFSTSLIIGTLVITKQIQYTKARDIGYDQENLIFIWHNEEIGKRYNVIKEDLLASGVVAAVTKSNSPITDVHANNFVDWAGKPKEEKTLFANLATEYDYTKTMGIKMLEGRDFSPQFRSDTAAVVINKAAAEMIGVDDIIGTKITFWGERTATIVGVMDNFVMESPLERVRPLFMVMIPEWVSAVTIRLEKTTDLQAALKTVEGIFRKHDPAHPFEYSFVDEQFQKKFNTITMVSRVAGIFAFLAIFITSLGLFGLAAFTAEQRTKEIGIRKVLGATVTNLVTLIVKEFSWLVMVALAIAGPLSWWGLNYFLQQYAYRIDFPWWAIAVAGGSAMIFAMAIVGTQALRAANENPVKSLTNE